MNEYQEKRLVQLKQRIVDALAEQDLKEFRKYIDEFLSENEVDPADVAAAMVFVYDDYKEYIFKKNKEQSERNKPRGNRGGYDKRGGDKRGGDRRDKKDRSHRRDRSEPEPGMESYRIEVGRKHRVRPGNIVGAIANEVGIEGSKIGHIKIEQNYSIVDLPEGMPREALEHLRGVWVAGQQLNITRVELKSKQGDSRGKSKSEEDSRPQYKVYKKDD